MELTPAAESTPDFEIFTAARLRDFPVLLAAANQCRTLWRKSTLVVAVPSADEVAVARGLKGLASVIKEDELLKDFDRNAFKIRPIAHFPQAFGWYLQQILKIEYCRQSGSPYCLVWDADTVPLEKIEFVDSNGRIYLTKAKEFHRPYFHTISKLLALKPPAETSFISQHMFVRCQAMRDMCSMIQDIHGVSNWTEAMGNVLERHPNRENLFSEYETYANYMLACEPESVTTRDLPWGRYHASETWSVPIEGIVTARKHRLTFAAFESRNALTSRVFLKSLEKAPSFFKRLAVAVALRQATALACGAAVLGPRA